MGTLQRTGDNILPLILSLVNSEYLANVQAHSKGNLVFFDFLGVFIVSGKEILATVVNVVIIALMVYSVWNNSKQSLANGEYTILNSLMQKEIADSLVKLFHRHSASNICQEFIYRCTLYSAFLVAYARTSHDLSRSDNDVESSSKLVRETRVDLFPVHHTDVCSASFCRSRIPKTNKKGKYRPAGVNCS